MWSLGEDSVPAMREVGIRGAMMEDAEPDSLSPSALVRVHIFGKKVRITHWGHTGG
jgi:hypothetical protein